MCIQQADRNRKNQQRVASRCVHDQKEGEERHKKVLRRCSHKKQDFTEQHHSLHTFKCSRFNLIAVSLSGVQESV